MLVLLLRFVFVIITSVVIVRCIVCLLSFCCSSSRWRHEQSVHKLSYDCKLCRKQNHLYRPEDIENKDFLQHLAERHLPLRCLKCLKFFVNIESFTMDRCCASFSELVDDNAVEYGSIIDEFKNLYEKTVKTVNENEANEHIEKVRKAPVETDSSDESTDEQADYNTPKAVKLMSPTPNMPLKFKRSNTPYIRKMPNLIKHKKVELSEREELRYFAEIGNNEETTPVRNEEEKRAINDATTPTSHINERCLMLAQAVTTSTPTNPINNGWTMFPEQNVDSPISEIEGTTGDSSSTHISVHVHDTPKVETPDSKTVKSILTSSRLRLRSQDSSEKHVDFQDSPNSDSSHYRIKKVTFAEDTVFNQDKKKIRRVLQKPKRTLTPGPPRLRRQKSNPNFQMILNKFENRLMATTPVNSNKEREQEFIPNEHTPQVGEYTNKPARAINFKDDSPTVDIERSAERESNELFKTCIDSPPASNSSVALNTAVSALTTNIAGSLENCIGTALKTNDEETEIKFKFVITRRKVYTKKLSENTAPAEVKDCPEEVDTDAPQNTNIFTTVYRAVRNVFFSDKKSENEPSTPVNSKQNNNENVLMSSGYKRKSGDVSPDLSPEVYNKRRKYYGRIQARPPLHRDLSTKPDQDSHMKSTHSAEQQNLINEVITQGEQNQ